MLSVAFSLTSGAARFVGLGAMAAVCAASPACGGSIGAGPTKVLDSGTADASADAADSADPGDAGSARDGGRDVAPDSVAETGPPTCAMGLDPTFGEGGIATLVNPPYARPWAPGTVAFDSGGRILVAAMGGTTASLGVARFDASGAIDATYGAGGFAPVSSGYPGGLVVQPDGKSLITAQLFTVARLDEDGTVDTTFGAGGFATAPISRPGGWLSLALLDDGSILLGGQETVAQREVLLLAKYDRDGADDTTFGTGGLVSSSTLYRVECVLAQADGAFLVAGNANAHVPVQAALERYSATGALDVTFGSGGTATAPASLGEAYVTGMVRQSTGAIVLSLGMFSTPNDDFALVRFTPDGRLDPTFGNGGVARTDFFGSGDYPAGLSLAQGDGLLVAGTVREPIDDAGNVPSHFGVARYTADGRPDTTFAPGGKLVTRFPQLSWNELDSQALQADGKLVVAAYGERPSSTGHDVLLTLARYGCQ
jgi:uncharacterized delta-60 repeat protein